MAMCCLPLIACQAHQEIAEEQNIENHEEQKSDEFYDDAVIDPYNSTEKRVNDDYASIMEQLEGMTLSEKIGQLVMVGLEGYTPDDTARLMIEEHHVGGFILFNRNIKDVDQTIQLINDLKTINTAQVPLFFGMDEEGGRVTRIPSTLTPLPTALKIGERNKPELAMEMAKQMGLLLGGLGINVNFSPVLDIHSNPRNPVIGSRAYADNPDRVSEIGLHVAQGYRDANIIPVAKHFPGHGDTYVDSHLGLPVIKHDLKRIKELELKPFKSAVQEEIEMIMIGHLLVQAIDEELPSSLSPLIINQLLREEMGYSGVVITDDLTMGAITDYNNTAEAAVMAIKAGADIVMICHDIDLQFQAIEAIKQAVVDGRLSEDRVNQSVLRILTLKHQYQLNNELTLERDIDEISERIKRLIRSK